MTTAANSATTKRNFIVFDHPYTATACDNVPHDRSFSAALCKAITGKLAARGEQVDLADLHADHFDPVMSKTDLANWRKGVPMNDQVADYQRRMLAADRIIFIFPIWWELMPAMTKGFLDKVYAKNILYTQPKDAKIMQTKLKRDVEVVIVTTMSTPKWIYHLLFCKPIAKAMRFGMCYKTGIRHFRWLNYSQVDKLTLEQRQQLLGKVRI
ncbi:NAD(P)H-dependent oxidoreductase [Bifidobacterium choloepi]|uniref:NADPH:quinone reductase n=1 Tax=Bifidobacterium choloepi TaxID=2614131 RepID=A0A6I5N2X5_9BIFI|nr:NAD(P)H-dependent oxidoreductase [Bifidobacterium choloepi]NEG70009.1 NADPH:quinone reductase [Bifidobacterium choloepi]